jgi:Family of unknown function (DUF6460)
MDSKDKALSEVSEAGSSSSTFERSAKHAQESVAPEDAWTKFLGGSPRAAAVRLLIASFIIGFFMISFDVRPEDFFELVAGWIERLMDMGFDAVFHIGRYFIYGAAVVIPVWLVIRLLKFWSKD